MHINNSGRHVLVENKPVATIRKTNTEEHHHNKESPWILEYASGRIDRFQYKYEAEKEALKSFGMKLRYMWLI